MSEDCHELPAEESKAKPTGPCCAYMPGNYSESPPVMVTHPKALLDRAGQILFAIRHATNRYICDTNRAPEVLWLSPADYSVIEAAIEAMPHTVKCVPPLNSIDGTPTHMEIFGLVTLKGPVGDNPAVGEMRRGAYPQ